MHVAKRARAGYLSPMLPTGRAALLVILCSLGTGCSNLAVQKPTASVKSMSVRGVDAEGFVLDFLVDVSNPNGFALPVAAADYELGMGGVRVLDGEAKPEASIPANGSRAVTVPVSIAFDQLLAAEAAIRDSGGNVPYDLAGGLSFDTGAPLVGRVRVPLRHSGTIPLRRILSDPEALLRSPAAKRLAAAVFGSFFRR